MSLARRKEHASRVPVIPEPIIQMSASEVRVPSLPSAANGFASGVELIQKDFVGLGAGRLAGGCELGCSSTFCWFEDIDNLDISVRQYDYVGKLHLHMNATWLIPLGFTNPADHLA